LRGRYALAALALVAGCGSDAQPPAEGTSTSSAASSPPDTTVSTATAGSLAGTIAFTNDRPHVGHGGEDNAHAGIWVMNADGTGQRRVFELTNGTWDSCPRISPDGTTIAIRRFEPRRFDGIFLVPVAGGTAREVAVAPVRRGEPGTANAPIDLRVSCPVWSPDGKRLAFATLFDLWTVGVDGSDLRQVAVTDPEGHDLDDLTDWSDDGRTLAGDNGLRVSLVDIESGRVTRLGDGRNASLSPDGRQVVFDDYREEDEGGADLWLMDIDGSNRRRLVPHRAVDEHPVWSPDGRHIVFSSRRDHYDLVEQNARSEESRNRWFHVPWERGYSGIYAVAADGSDLRLLTPVPPALEPWNWDATHPTWGG
jgi:Tol biopolymer transport system component